MGLECNASDPLAKLEGLGLANNQIGDAGVTALAQSCARGAMASLEDFAVDNPDHPELMAACEAHGISLI